MVSRFYRKGEVKMNDILAKLNTEQQNPNTVDIDVCSTSDILKKINDEDKKVALVVEKQLPAITALVDAAFASLQKGGRIIYAGAGTSGRLGILDASECPPTYGVSEELIQGIIAGGTEAIFKAKEGAEDSKELAKQDLIERNLGANDMVIGLAASGRTPYVIGALEYAKEIGATTGSVCCVKDAEISAYAEFPVEVVTGPEAVTGSTRMKAGTAQKLVLNMISTATMIKSGKVFHNYMVDVQPTNQKLEVRACHIIETLGKVDGAKAKELFIVADKNVKTAIVMALTNKSRSIVEEILNKTNGHITKSVELLKEE